MAANRPRAIPCVEVQPRSPPRYSPFHQSKHHSDHKNPSTTKDPGVDSQQIPIPYMHVFESSGGKTVMGKVRLVHDSCSPIDALSHRIKPPEVGNRRVVSKSNRHRILNNSKLAARIKSNNTSRAKLLKNMYQ